MARKVEQTSETSNSYIKLMLSIAVSQSKTIFLRSYAVYMGVLNNILFTND